MFLMLALLLTCARFALEYPPPMTGVCLALALLCSACDPSHPASDGPPLACEHSCHCAANEACVGGSVVSSYRSVCATRCNAREDCAPGQECRSISTDRAAGYVCLTPGNPAPCPGAVYDPAWDGCHVSAETCDGSNLLIPYVEQTSRTCGYSAIRCIAGCGRNPGDDTVHCL